MKDNRKMTFNNDDKANHKSSTRIKTKLKFKRSDKTNAMVGFVSQNPVTGMMFGVREEDRAKKKICIVDAGIAANILPNCLYDCVLIPMAEKNGYIVIEAKITQFTATITTNYEAGHIYSVDVSFGNKKLRFDPFRGKHETVVDLAKFIDVLRKRVDIRDINNVVSKAEKACQKIVMNMIADKYK